MAAERQATPEDTMVGVVQNKKGLILNFLKIDL